MYICISYTYIYIETFRVFILYPTCGILSSLTYIQHPEVIEMGLPVII